jgi:hypothetical protein
MKDKNTIGIIYKLEPNVNKLELEGQGEHKGSLNDHYELQNIFLHRALLVLLHNIVYIYFFNYYFLNLTYVRNYCKM